MTLQFQMVFSATPGCCSSNIVYRLDTVKPLILAALNFDGYSYEIILAPLILVFLLVELLVILYNKLLFKHS